MNLNNKMNEKTKSNKITNFYEKSSKLDPQKVYKQIVEYTFGDGTKISSELLSILYITDSEEKKRKCKDLILEMRKKLIEYGYVDLDWKSTDKYREMFPLASLNDNRKYGSYKVDGIKYSECGLIEILYLDEVDGYTDCSGHTYYNELDHYFTHVLNFYPILNDNIIFTLGVPLRSKGNAKEPGIYAIICDCCIDKKQAYREQVMKKLENLTSVSNDKEQADQAYREQVMNELELLTSDSSYKKEEKE